MKYRPLRLMMCVLCVGAMLSSDAVAQSPSLLQPALVKSFPRTMPEEMGMSSEKLDRIAELLREEVASGKIAGGVVLILRGGHQVYRVGVGFADVEAQAPMATDTIFRIASMTKPITSVAVLQLADRGKLAITDPVSKYIPEFAAMRVLAPPPADATAESRTVPAEREITIHDLLTHTSGITYGFWGEEPISSLYGRAQVSDGLIETPWDLAENARRLAALPLVAQPGSRWQYGLSTDVLARIVEVASGQPFDDYLRGEILEPLGMVDTHFSLPAGKRLRLAALYRPDDNERIQRTPAGEVTNGTVHYSSTFPLDQNKAYFSGGAGLVSTAGDYARFCQMLQNGGTLDGERILSEDSVHRMTSNQIGDLSVAFTLHGGKFGYGVGVLSDAAAGTEPASVGTYSWGGIFNTVFWVDPQQELVGILMTQLYPFDHLSVREDFKRLMYAAITGPMPTSHNDTAATQEPTPALGPQPGDVYREFALHNGGNIDWRVTDPRATAEGAHKFLPNPVLKLTVGDLQGAIRAEALLDRWGGHLKTTGKQVRFNGNPWIIIPDLSTPPAGHAPRCTIHRIIPSLPSRSTICRKGSTSSRGHAARLRTMGGASGVCIPSSSACTTTLLVWKPRRDESSHHNQERRSMSIRSFASKRVGRSRSIEST